MNQVCLSVSGACVHPFAQKQYYVFFYIFVLGLMSAPRKVTTDFTPTPLLALKRQLADTHIWLFACTSILGVIIEYDSILHFWQYLKELSFQNFFQIQTY